MKANLQGNLELALHLIFSFIIFPILYLEVMGLISLDNKREKRGEKMWNEIIRNFDIKSIRSEKTSKQRFHNINTAFPIIKLADSLAHFIYDFILPLAVLW